MKSTKMNLLGLFLIGLFFVTACNDDKKKKDKESDTKPDLPKSGELEKKGGDVKTNSLSNQIKLSFGEPSSDASKFTFGTMPITLDAQAGAGISVKRLLYLKSSETIPQEIKDKVQNLCKDVGLSSDPLTASKVEVLPDNKQVHLIWRSHYNAPLKRQVAQLLSIKDTSIRCLLKVDVGGRASYVVLDPIPASSSGLIGTSQIELAKSEALMIIDSASIEKSEIFDDKASLIEVAQDAELKPGITALHRSDIRIPSFTQLPGVCRYVLAEGKMKLLDPDTTRYSDSVFNFQNTKIVPQKSALLPTGGRFLKSCEKLQLFKYETYRYSNVTCQQYLDIQEEGGLDAACQWAHDFANQDDLENSVAVNSSLEKVIFRQMEAGSLQAAAWTIPSSPINPITLNSIKLLSFSSDQINMLKKSFDLFILNTPDDYNELFRNHTTYIIYGGDYTYQKPGTAFDSACGKEGIAAFNTLGRPEMTLCTGSGLGEAYMSDEYRPSSLIQLAMTLNHENLHGLGRNHDFQNSSYAPCMGTAYSAHTARNLAVDCKDSYCGAFRDLAVLQFRKEMNYSLQGDARRFQGLCKTWADDMGLKPIDIDPSYVP